MSWSPEELDKEVLDAVNSAVRYGFLTSGVEFQREHVAKLAVLHVRLKELREQAIRRAVEPMANGFYRSQMLVAGMMKFLEMWVLLKADKCPEAWDKLVDAQAKLRIAQRIIFDPETDRLLVHLASVEKAVFPHQMFFSTAYEYTDGTCTVCDRSFDECDHVSGLVYMGQICRRIIERCSVTEFSVVDHPKDKRCRVAEYSEGGKTYCTLTGRELPHAHPYDPSQFSVGGVIMCGD